MFLKVKLEKTNLCNFENICFCATIQGGGNLYRVSVSVYYIFSDEYNKIVLSTK